MVLGQPELARRVLQYIDANAPEATWISRLNKQSQELMVEETRRQLRLEMARTERLLQQTGGWLTLAAERRQREQQQNRS